MLLLEPWLAHVGGALLFAIGALIWVLRSNYRRYDKHKKSFVTKHKVLPEAIYEFIPFGYLASAVLLLSIIMTLPTVVIACAACFRGLQLLHKRSLYRSRGLSPAN